MKEKREAWREKQDKIDTKKAFFLDETSVNLGMTRLYGRAPRNERVVEYVPDVRFERTSLIGALGLNGFIAPMMFKGTLNGDFFAGYVEQFLAPLLSPGDTVFMDNLSAHKVSGVLDPIYERGANVVFLPEYSPDLNPVELMFSKLKSVLRKLKPRTVDELQKAICYGLDSVTLENIKNWFSFHGYKICL